MKFMRKVYDNGRIIEHENRFYTSYPYFIDFKNRKDRRKSPEKWNLYFKTEEEAHSYAQENGLKEDEYFIARWMV